MEPRSPMNWTVAARHWSSSRGTALYRACRLNRGSFGSGPMGFEAPGLAVIRPRELMGCAGLAKPKLGSISNIVRKRLYITWKAFVAKYGISVPKYR